MKLSDDQKQILRNWIYYAAGYIVFYPFFRWLFTKEISWSDFLTSGITAIFVGLAGILFVIGAKIPKK